MKKLISVGVILAGLSALVICSVSSSKTECLVYSQDDFTKYSNSVYKYEFESFVMEEVNPYEAEPMTPEDYAEEKYYDSLEYLACCVECEAGNQSLLGKRLVVDVILNRVDSDLFADDIIGVIQEEGQFSTYSNGAIDRLYEPSEDSFKAVSLEVFGERTDSTILYFTAEDYNPYCIPMYKVGNHYFGR